MVRHQRLLDLVESADWEAMLDEVARHRSRRFLGELRRLFEL